MSTLDNSGKKADCKELPSYKTTIPISFYLTLSTFIFSYAGYLYAKTYYTNFGISVGRFFALEDYIRNSINVLYMAIVPIVPNLIFMLLIDRSKIPHKLASFTLGNKAEEGKGIGEGRKKGVWLFLILMFIIFFLLPIFVVIYEFYRGGPEKYIVYMCASIFLCVQFFLRAKDGNWFGLKSMDWLFLTSFFGFLVAVYFLAQFGAHLDKDKSFQSNVYKKAAVISTYEFKTNVIPEKFRHIGSTSQYMFLFDSEENYTLVIPASDFVHAKIKLTDN
jgi:hypothetical protein